MDSGSNNPYSSEEGTSNTPSQSDFWGLSGVPLGGIAMNNAGADIPSTDIFSEDADAIPLGTVPEDLDPVVVPGREMDPSGNMFSAGSSPPSLYVDGWSPPANIAAGDGWLRADASLNSDGSARNDGVMGENWPDEA